MPLLRPLRPDDLDALLPLQEEGAVAALAHIFPQETHPFPRTEVRARWVHELADSAIRSFAAEEDGVLVGFAATRRDELFHLGTARRTWGSGLAGRVHDELVATIAESGHRVAWLRVFEENRRAISFYERRGWVATDEVSWSLFAPHPALRRFELALG
ncbi:GNAT family N-acetyltransferase [Phycicoccus sonneratiae]|uniref:GNAT family N-acetyltransferase n=1 Tax=Phycicoccus sonneratiae TaxID=2807628 RepID=A0ABS2CJR6_9MICO|nr:GNAT family N-acetyltransferase [Phycicoccus sonneraticus]MBM6399324.1 GNAT family N-acetyltransferase [Phycicoccus sonneraticus]